MDRKTIQSNPGKAFSKGSGRSTITFCIITMNRTRWLANVLKSIREYCPIKYQIKLLIIGELTQELRDALRECDGKIDLVTSPVNLGCGGGRALLAQGIATEFTMMLDDDMYLTDGAIANALDSLQSDDLIGAVAIPQNNIHGKLISPGGRNLVIKNGVISRVPPELGLQRKLIEVEDLDNGAMLMKTEMLKDFQWDIQVGALHDLDKSLQIVSAGKWKQAVVANARLVHDRSWLQDPHEREYVRTRLDGLTIRRSYDLFRRKWGLRLDLRSHIYLELVLPLLTLIPSQRPSTALDAFLRDRRGT
jgi:GT2 family glycosyltransferase